jgi:hypothetical protein
VAGVWATCRAARRGPFTPSGRSFGEASIQRIIGRLDQFTLPHPSTGRDRLPMAPRSACSTSSTFPLVTVSRPVGGVQPGVRVGEC